MKAYSIVTLFIFCLLSFAAEGAGLLPGNRHQRNAECGWNKCDSNSVGLYVYPHSECRISPCTGHVGRSSLNYPGGYKYVFSSPVAKIRAHFSAIDPRDTMSIVINGSHYNITTSNLSNFLGSCYLTAYNVVISGGNLGGTDPGFNLVQFDALPSNNIDSVEIDETYSLGYGVVWDFFFADVCFGSVVAHSNYDTLCLGSSLQLYGDTASISTFATYSWSGPNNFSATQQNPTAINLSVSDSGIYTLTVADTANCTYVSSVHITIDSVPSVSISSNSPLCQGDTLYLNTNSSLLGSGYNWAGPNNFSSSQQNISVFNAQLNDPGIYSVVVNFNNCSDTASINVSIATSNPPIIYITAYPSGSISMGDSISFSTLSSNATNPTYQWKRNGTNIVGATSPVYATNSVTNGEVFSCEVRSSNNCQAVDSAISNAATVHTITHLPPNVTMGVTSGNGATVFTGHTGATNDSLGYTWTKNGVTVPGANGDIYITNNVQNGDIICILVHDYAHCTFPEVDTVYSIVALGVNSVNPASGIKIYQYIPTPFTTN